MKIALLRQRPAARGGAETALAHLSRGLAAAGHDVAVYGSGKVEDARRLLGPGVEFVPVPLWGGKTGRTISYALNVRRLLGRSPERLVFSLERTLTPDVYRAGDGCHREWLRRRSFYLHTGARLTLRLSLFHRVMLGLEKRLFAAPGLLRVIANSRQAQGEITGHYGLAPEKLRVIHNGLDRHRFRPLEEPEAAARRSRLGAGAGTRVILFLGSGFERKGLVFLIRAFADLRDKKNVLWVAGKGPAPRYRHLAKSLGVGDRVKFWGPQEDPAPFYQAAAVMALPTIYDPCSNAVLEALGCGCPVVTTAANGASEFITPGINGAVLDQPHDTGALSLALEECLNLGLDPLGRRAAAAAVAHLSWERAVARTLEVLEEAAAVKG